MKLVRFILKLFADKPAITVFVPVWIACCWGLIRLGVGDAAPYVLPAGLIVGFAASLTQVLTLPGRKQKRE